MNCARSITFRLLAASRIAPGATIGVAPTLAHMIGTPTTNTVAAAMVTANLRKTTAGFCDEIAAPCSLMFATADVLLGSKFTS
jgi:hypothetical protein